MVHDVLNVQKWVDKAVTPNTIINSFMEKVLMNLQSLCLFVLDPFPYIKMQWSESGLEIRDIGEQRRNFMYKFQ